MRTDDEYSVRMDCCAWVGAGCPGDGAFEQRCRCGVSGGESGGVIVAADAYCTCVVDR